MRHLGEASDWRAAERESTAPAEHRRGRSRTSPFAEIREEGGVAAIPPGGGARELGRVLGRSILVERAGEGLANVEQPVGDRVDDELVVPVRLLRVPGPGRVPGLLRLGRLGEQIGVVGCEQAELPLDEVVEAASAAKSQISSS